MKNFNKFLKIKNQTDNTADLYIYGTIISGSWKWEESDVTSIEVREHLKSIEDVEELNIYINSDGGDVFTAMAIYNMLKRHKAKKTVYVDGIAASAATFIMMIGDKIVIPENAYMMVHKPWSYMVGNADDMRKMAESLDKIQEGMLNLYENKAIVEINVIKDLVDKETWLTGSEAAQYFDVEVGKEVEIAACASENFKNYKNIPKQLEKIKNKKEEKVETDIQNEDLDLELMELELKIKTI